MTRSQRASDCALCQLGASVEGDRLPRADVVVAYVDDELIGLIPSDRPGMSLAPREHTGGLGDTVQASATILAPLRRLVEEVKSSYGVAEATIEPTTELPGAAGHVYYQVVPVLAGEVDVPSDTSTRVAALADTLRHAAADRRPQPCIRPHRGPNPPGRH